MGPHELAIVGYCAGEAKALRHVCHNYFDKLWVDIHCLKEQMVERWLSYRVGAEHFGGRDGNLSGDGDESRLGTPGTAGTAGDHTCSGGGVSGVHVDGFRKNLCGVFSNVSEVDFEDAVADELKAIVERHVTAAAGAGGRGEEFAAASAVIAKIQSYIMLAQW